MYQMTLLVVAFIKNTSFIGFVGFIDAIKLLF